MRERAAHLDAALEPAQAERQVAELVARRARHAVGVHHHTPVYLDELDGALTSAKDRVATFFDDGALRITAIEVDHSPIEPAYAYRFDYKGRSASAS